MKIDRQSILDVIDSFRPILENPVLKLSAAEKESWLKELDEAAQNVRYARYRVTVLGAFSSGKSTFLNALLQKNLLPTADLATTAINTELYAADDDQFFIPFFDKQPSQEMVDNFRTGLSQLCTDTPYEVLISLNREGHSYFGLGARFIDNSGDSLRVLLAELTAEQNRKGERFRILKKLLNSNQSLPIWVGLRHFPEELRDIVLTDAPGLGSVSDSHEVIINRIIPQTHLVLYLVDSTKPGSTVDSELSARISSRNRRCKIFYLLNKVDQQNDDERQDAEFSIKSSLHPIVTGCEQPEFQQVSGLYAYLAVMLDCGRMKTEEVCRIPKFNPFNLLADPLNFFSETSDKHKQRAILSRALMSDSLFPAVKERIIDYLQNENKEFKLAESPLNLICSLSSHLLNSCQRTKELFASGYDIKTLQEKQAEARRQREAYQSDIETCLSDFSQGALSSGNCYRDIIARQSAVMSETIYEEFMTALEDKKMGKQFMSSKSGALQEWLQEKLKERYKGMSEVVDSDFRKRMKDLLNKVQHLAVKLDNTNLSALCRMDPEVIPDAGVSVNISADPKLVMLSGVVGGGTLAAGGTYLASSIAGLGTLVTTTPITVCTASGLAGFLSSVGLTTASGWAASAGAGTLGAGGLITTTSTLWGLPALFVLGPAFLLGGAVLATAAYFGADFYRRKKMLKDVRENLRNIIFDGYTDPDGKKVRGICPQLTENVEGCIKSYMDTIKRMTQERIEEMEEQERLNLVEMQQKEEANKKAIQELDGLLEQISHARNEAVETLKSY